MSKQVQRCLDLIDTIDHAHGLLAEHEGGSFDKRKFFLAWSAFCKAVSEFTGTEYHALDNGWCEESVAQMIRACFPDAWVTQDLDFVEEGEPVMYALRTGEWSRSVLPNSCATSSVPFLAMAQALLRTMHWHVTRQVCVALCDQVIDLAKAKNLMEVKLELEQEKYKEALAKLEQMTKTAVFWKNYREKTNEEGFKNWRNHVLNEDKWLREAALRAEKAKKDYELQKAREQYGMNETHYLALAKDTNCVVGTTSPRRWYHPDGTITESLEFMK